MSSFTHLVLTRFNVRVDAAWSRAATDPAWLEHRFALFDRYCYPSVRDQTAPSFRWLIFFDAQTPEPFRARIADYARTPCLRPVFIERFDPAVVNHAIAESIEPGSTHLISTRMDNDDALRLDHLALVQEQFREQQREFVNFDRGYILRGAKLYENRHRSNAFASLIERLAPDGSFCTVWAWQHMKIADAGPVLHIPSPPAWLQIIHGKNVSNRVRGVRRRADALADGFPFALEGLRSRDSALGVALDRAFLEPVRGVRDTIIALGRRAREALQRRTPGAGADATRD